MPGKAHATQDHAKIRKWAEARGGKPTMVAATRNPEDGGILRIDFPGFSGEGSLEEISWGEFFRIFDDKNLALIYQEKTHQGEPSRFCRFVYREHAKDISEPDFHTHVTNEPEKVRAWAEARQGTPAIVASTRDDPSGGILRIDFPGYSGEDTLEQISWDTFGEIFSKNKLAFLYQEQTKDGSHSRFCRFISVV